MSSGGDIWRCPTCGTAFFEEGAMKGHSFQVHGEFVREGETEPDQISMSEEPDPSGGPKFPYAGPEFSVPTD